MIYKRGYLEFTKSDNYVYFSVIDKVVTRVFIDEIDALNYIHKRVHDNSCHIEYEIKRIRLEDIGGYE